MLFKVLGAGRDGVGNAWEEGQRWEERWGVWEWPMWKRGCAGVHGVSQVWGVPGQLEDPVRPLGDWGVARSAPLTLGRSLGEDWSELCGSELLAGLFQVPGAGWELLGSTSHSKSRLC